MAKVSFKQTVLDLDPLAWYRLGESSGSVAVDSSGNGNDGSYDDSGGGTITLGEDGVVESDPDTAVSKSGNAAVDLGSVGDFDAPGFTLCGWIQSTDTGGYIATRMDGTNTQWSWIVTTVGDHGFRFDDSAGEQFFIAPLPDGVNGIDLLDGQRHFVAVTVKSDRIVGMIDGVVDVDTGTPSFTSHAIDTLIGARRTSPTSGFGFVLDGTFDEWIVFDRELTIQELREIYIARLQEDLDMLGQATGTVTGTPTTTQLTVDLGDAAIAIEEGDELVFESGQRRTRRIAAVTDNGDGTWAITVDPAFPKTPSAGDVVRIGQTAAAFNRSRVLG